MPKIFSTTFLGRPCFHCLPKYWCSCFKEVKFCCHLTNYSGRDAGCPGAVNWSWTYLWKLCFQKKQVQQNGQPSLWSLWQEDSLFSRWAVATVCYSFLLLRLILFLAAKTGHLRSLAAEKVDPNYRSCFVSVSVLYFLLNGTELLRWLFFGEQYITRAASVHLNQELRPGLGWDISFKTWREGKI